MGPALLLSVLLGLKFNSVVGHYLGKARQKFHIKFGYGPSGFVFYPKGSFKVVGPYG